MWAIQVDARYADGHAAIAGVLIESDSAEDRAPGPLPCVFLEVVQVGSQDAGALRAAVHGLEFAESFGFRTLEIRTDSMKVGDWLSSAAHSPVAADKIDETRSRGTALLAAHPGWAVKVVRGTTNREAHTLARLGLSIYQAGVETTTTLLPLTAGDHS